MQLSKYVVYYSYKQIVLEKIMYKTWNVLDESAKIEGQAIARHNELRIVPKKCKSVRRPDVTALAIFVPVKNCGPSEKPSTLCWVSLTNA